MKKNSLNLKVSILLLVIYIATYVVDLFTTKAITISSVALCVAAILVLTLVSKKMKSMYYVGIALFAFLSQYLGAMLNVYTIIPTYDFILHFSSGTLLVLLADYGYECLIDKHPQASVPNIIRLLFTFFIAVASAAIWEIWEYSGDKLFGLQSQGGLDDTMTDIIAGSMGAIIGFFLLKSILNKTKKRTVKG
ncbi:MAG: hypothetical protein WAX04_10825 [Oscillospiraceae bacterium]